MGGDGLCYKAFAESYTFEEAHDACQAMDAHLLSIQTVNENNFVSEWLHNQFPGKITLLVNCCHPVLSSLALIRIFVIGYLESGCMVISRPINLLNPIKTNLTRKHPTNFRARSH